MSCSHSWPCSRACPLLVLLSNSLKSTLELGQNPLGIPKNFDWANFANAWEQGNLGQGMLNSPTLVAATIVGVWICAGMAAYALARLEPAVQGADSRPTSSW